MPAFEKEFIITAKDGTTATLVPFVGMNSSGPVSATLPVADQDIQGGLSQIVLTFTTTPTDFFKRVGGKVRMILETPSA
jgi:hypothetical protein